jgi:hypothetical protein
MNLIVVGMLLFAFAADPPGADPQRGSAPTPGDANRMGETSQRGSRGYTPGGDERTGPPAAGVESGDANGMAGGRTDQGPRGGTGIREGGARIRREKAQARVNAQARRRNSKRSFERPADAPPQMNPDPTPMGSGAPMRSAVDQPRPQGRNYVEGPQHGAAGGVASGVDEASGGSSPAGAAGKGAETQPDRREKGGEPETPRTEGRSPPPDDPR